MSRLEELIQEYCPDGVEYLLLKSVSEYSKIRIPASSVDKTTYVGVDNILQNKLGIKNAEHVPSNGSLIKYVAGDILIGNIRPYLRKIWLADRTGGTNGDVLVIHLCVKNIIPEYLYYCLSSETFFEYDVKYSKGAKMPRGDKQAVMEYEIPVPPLPVQQEIVRILDEFTEKTTELKDQLEAELEARKKQYEYYRDWLMTPKDGWEKHKLGDIGTLTRGKRFVKADAVENGTPCIHYGELYTHYGIWADKVKSHVNPDLAPKLRYAQKNDVVIVGAGENDWDIGVGVAWLGDESVAVHDACYTFHHEQEPKFISYYLRTTDYHQQIKKYVSTGKICAISAEGIGQSVLYLPTLDEQRRIVSKLDSFDEHISSMKIGLPAEIEARQKQYEYYRGKLLTFERKP